jgi:trigger factor
MNVKIEAISSVSKRLSFDVAAEQVNREIAAAYKQIAKTAKIKGFRKGKVPMAMLEKYYQPQMQEKVFTRLINDTYFEALAEHKIPAISEPKITESGELEKDKEFTYSAEVEVKPEVEAKDYAGLVLEKEKFKADPEVLEKRLEGLQSSRTEQQVTIRKKARQGDFVTIDFKGFVEGETFAGGSAEGHVLELGSGSFIPGFEEQVEGLKRDEETDIEVIFPSDYGNKELAGKPAVFKVTVREIKEKVLPKLDDEFAKEFGVESLVDLREKLQAEYNQQEKNRIEGDLKERLMTALIEKNPIEVPESMVSHQLDYMMQNIKNRMQSQGMTLEMLGMNAESFRQMYRDAAVMQVQGSLLLEAVISQENLALDESEIDSKIVQIAEMANAPVDAVKNYYNGDGMRDQLVGQILEEKAIECLLGKSKINEVPKEKLQPEPEVDSSNQEKE